MPRRWILLAASIAVLVPAGGTAASQPASASAATELSLSILYPWDAPACPNECHGGTLPIMAAQVSGGTTPAFVTWSTGAGSGEAELVCPSARARIGCDWEARDLPILVGVDTLTVTARDAAGGSIARSVIVGSVAASDTYNVDCSASVNGDGRATTPFDNLWDPQVVSLPGAPIQIDGGRCLIDFPLFQEVTIRGDPERPRAEVTTDFFIDAHTWPPATLRHLRYVPFGGNRADSIRAEGAELILEDV